MSGPAVADRRRDPWRVTRLVFAWGIFVVWLVSAILRAVPAVPRTSIQDYTPLMMIVTGALFAPEAFQKVRQWLGAGKDDKDE